MLAPFSLTPVLDINGKLIRTAALQVFQAGTTTPVVVYKQADYAADTEHPNPIPVNGAGLLPAMYGAGAFKFRALTAPVGGSIVWEADGVTLTDPPSLTDTGAGEATDTAKTGDLKHRYDTGTHPGWARLNGRTIGNAASGATERAAADTQALFLLLWTVDDSLVVVGGRGQSAQQDYDAGKQMTLPDASGRLLAGLDGMGAPASGSYGTQTWNTGGSATRLGSTTGVWSATLGIANLPAHDPPFSVDVAPGGGFNYSGTVGAKSVPHTHGVGVSGFNITIGGPTSIFTVSDSPTPAVQYQTQPAGITHDHSFNVTVGDHDHNVTAALGQTGSGTALPIANRLMLVTTYIKL
jgi:hypothetical protein